MRHIVIKKFSPLVSDLMDNQQQSHLYKSFYGSTFLKDVFVNSSLGFFAQASAIITLTVTAMRFKNLKFHYSDKI